MTDYKFETDQFGLSDTKIHLLRSRFNYDNIELSTVDKIIIDKGRQVNNWFLLLMVGLLLFTFGLFTASKVIYEYFFANNFTRFYVEQFVLPVLPFLTGAFCLYFSFKIGPVLTIKFNDKTKRLPIGQLKSQAKIDKLVDFLQTNDLTRNKLYLELRTEDI
ncbi:hypothetical protein ACI6Q2_02295 [Chitinophagaceae bacterium LWZ2-11]